MAVLLRDIIANGLCVVNVKRSESESESESESRDILLTERKLLVALKNALMDKKTLLYSDIKKLVEANKSTF